MKDFKVIILMGRSGCGKGTQAKLLQKKFGFDYLSSGDLLRARTKIDDFSGQKLKKVMSQGNLAPTFLISYIWSEKIREIKNKPNLKGLIIDGSPRSLLEAELTSDIFEWYEWSDIKVILLDISDEEAFNRLTKRQRFDDKIEAIRSRLDFYKNDVQPTIDYYEKQGRLIKVNGQQSIEEVHQEIWSQLKLQKKLP